MDTLASVLQALSGMAWPLLCGVLIFSFRRPLSELLAAAVARVRGGDELKIGILTIGQSVGPLKIPLSDQAVTDDHLALIHRSWCSPNHDAKYGRPMHRIHVIVFGTPTALRRVDYVVYRLDKAYRKSTYVSDALKTNFELNELANGYSLLRAEVHIQDQTEPVRLSRFLDLMDESPKLAGTYQMMGNEDKPN